MRAVKEKNAFLPTGNFHIRPGNDELTQRETLL
jgi:hypothetical protein